MGTKVVVMLPDELMARIDAEHAKSTKAVLYVPGASVSRSAVIVGLIRRGLDIEPPEDVEEDEDNGEYAEVPPYRGE